MWRHKKKCKIETEENVTLEITPTSEVQELKEFMKYLMQCIFLNQVITIHLQDYREEQYIRI